MVTILVVLGLFGLSIFWMVMSVKQEWELGGSVSFVAGVMLFFALIVTSIEKDIKVTYEVVDVKIFDSPKSLVVIDKYGLVEIMDYAIIKQIDSTTTWKREHTTNLYRYKDVEDLIPFFKK